MGEEELEAKWQMIDGLKAKVDIDILICVPKIKKQRQVSE